MKPYDPIPLTGLVLKKDESMQIVFVKFNAFSSVSSHLWDSYRWWPTCVSGLTLWKDCMYFGYWTKGTPESVGYSSSIATMYINAAPIPLGFSHLLVLQGRKLLEVHPFYTQAPSHSAAFSHVGLTLWRSFKKQRSSEPKATSNSRLLRNLKAGPYQA